jgi:hypothetical protein
MVVIIECPPTSAGFEGITRAAPRCRRSIGTLCSVRALVGSRPTNMRIGEIRTAYRSRTRACGTSLRLSRRSFVNKSPSASYQREADLNAIHGSEPQMNTYPASEQRISDVERGRSCRAILPMPCAQTLAAGDSIVFALAYLDAGQETCFVKYGDSVCVSLTEVTDLGATDPANGEALFRFTWKPPGQSGSPGTSAKRFVKSSSAH